MGNDKMMMKQIVIICVFLIMLMPMSLAITGQICIPGGDCEFDDPGWQTALDDTYPDGVTGTGPGNRLVNGQLASVDGTPILAPKPDHPPGKTKIKGQRTTFTPKKGPSVDLPTGTFPSTAGIGSGAEQMFQAALGQIQGIMNLITSLDLKTLLAEKPTKDPGPDPSPTPSLGFSNIPNSIEIAGNTATLKGNAVIFQEERKGSRSAASEVNNKLKSGEITTGSTLENVIVSNTKTTFFDKDKKVLTAETPENPKTSIIFDPSRDIPSFAFTLPLINKLITHLSRTFVSAQPNQGQYIHLIGRDMDINGIKLKVIPYINLDYLKGGGQEIILDNGITVRIHNQKIHSSSLLKEIRIDIDELSNKLDPNHKYIVISDQELKGIIKSNDNIFYMTDDTENIKNGPYAKLMINKARLEMFS